MVATRERTMCKLHQTCSEQHAHVSLMGGSRAHDAEDYPDKLARAMVVLMAAPDHCDKLDDVFPLDDDDWDMHADHPEETTMTEEPRVLDDEAWTGEGL